MRKTFPTNFHLLFEVDLPEKSFLVENREHDVPCLFQIWAKREEHRILPEVLAPLGYSFVKIHEHPDISFRRVGVYAGNIDTDIAKSQQSHYFIRFTNDQTIPSVIEKLKRIEFDTNNTVGQKSISKQELIAKWNLVMQNGFAR